VIHLLAVLAIPLDAQPASPSLTPSPLSQTDAALGTPAMFDPVAARGLCFTPGAARELSKKEVWMREKSLRPDFHTSDAELMRGVAVTAKKTPGSSKRTTLPASMAPSNSAIHSGETLEPVTTLYNIWTHEALPLLPGEPVKDRFHEFLRDHFTNQPTHMDPKLVDVLTSVANKFSAKRIEIVSGYRSPKYNLMLRKKGHAVARHSQHMEGNAVDFRVRGVPTKTVLHYVKSLRVGGVGYYPHSQFVHSDTGRIRYWTGS
jgi:uncharacterized protein YcbK (DUF882 family)